MTTRRNVILLSMLRQPIRTALAMLLLVAASMAMILRLAEYFVVTQQIDGIGGYYKSIGYLQDIENRSVFDDISQGADIISKSQYVERADNRRTAMGILQGLNNSRLDRYIGTPESKLQYRHHTDTFFYGNLLGLKINAESYVTINPFIELSFYVESILETCNRSVREGDVAEIRYYLTDAEIDEYRKAFDYAGLPSDTSWLPTVIAGMHVGDRYFARYLTGTFANGKEYSTLLPLNADTSLESSDSFERGLIQLTKDPKWYIDMPEGTVVDSSSPGFEWLDRELKLMRQSMGAIQLLSTSDMTLMPLTQPESRMVSLVDGRWLDYDDQINARPVVVVNEFFADTMRLSVGDSLNISVPQDQVAAAPITIANGGRMFTEYLIDSPPSGTRYYDLDVSIVGIFGFRILNTTEYYMDELGALASTYIFVPDACLPADISVQYPAAENRWHDEQAYMPQFRYSFVLKDSRSGEEFLAENKKALADYGYDVALIDNGAMGFWAAAEPIIRAVENNVIIFAVVMLAAMLIIVFLLIRQRKKEIAIMRALGCSGKKTFIETILSFVAFATPSIIIGCAVGWRFVADISANTLNPFGEIATTFGFSLDTSLSVYLLPVFMVLIIALFAIVAALCIRGLSRRSVMELLYNRGVEVARRAAAVAATGSLLRAAETEVERRVAETEVERRAGIAKPSIGDARHALFGNRLRFALRFVLLRITRSALKTVLCAISALVFIAALCWIDSAITRSDNEIDHLYNSTTVKAELIPTNQGLPSPLHNIGDLIRPRVVREVVDSGYAQGIYYESAYSWGLLLPSESDGSFPKEWEKIAGYDHARSIVYNEESLDVLMGVSDLREFVQNNLGVGLYSDNDLASDIQIAYTDNYDESLFVFNEGKPIPVIISENAAHEYGLEVGNQAFIYINQPRTSLDGIYTGPWTACPVEVVGLHNSCIRQEELREAVVMPVSALEYVVGDNIGYLSMSLCINPQYNRDLLEVKNNLRLIMENPSYLPGWGVLLELFIYDEELQAVVGSMEQSLSLLHVAYPIAIALSIIIGLGLSMLLMAQNAIIASIMRILGTTKRLALTLLCSEQIVVNLAGLAVCVCLIAFLPWSANMLLCVAFACQYLAAVLIGSLFGAAVIVRRPPLALLQVRE
ncbi:MAG: FtsX-like permease family protein [Oscillospiraceae bacterium]|nr:FtsX-like permease family protein [Oscillospiraceae bacterium]